MSFADFPGGEDDQEAVEVAPKELDTDISVEKRTGLLISEKSEPAKKCWEMF